MTGHSCTIFEGGAYVGQRCGLVPVEGCGYAQCSGCRPGLYCSLDSWCVRYDEGCAPLGSAGLGFGLVIPVQVGLETSEDYECQNLSCPAVPVAQDVATGTRVDPCEMINPQNYWCRRDLCPEWPGAIGTGP